MRKGDLFGEMALLDHEKRSATVVAKEPCTILEIRGREFAQLMIEYPEIESRLLVTISRRLRNTGEQILGLHLTNVDEKLRLFNLKLDTEQRLVETSLRAAQAMFDQTKLRADEVISSAERSRDRLNKVVAARLGLRDAGPPDSRCVRIQAGLGREPDRGEIRRRRRTEKTKDQAEE